MRLRVERPDHRASRENVFNVSSRINSTWGGNLTDMVRSQRYFEIIEEEKLVENAAKVGAHFSAGSSALAEAFPSSCSNVRGRGLMCAFDLPDGDDPGQGDQRHGGERLLVLASGHQSIRFRPP